MLITASWVQTIRETLGIEAVSQVWGEKPAWYFWISGAPGVYQLEVAETASQKKDRYVLHRAIFALKCYPFPESPLFHTFSFEERSCIRSPLFDGSNTPYFEHRQKIPWNLFNVATVEYAFDQEESFAFFAFESLDTLRVSFGLETVRSYGLLGQNKRFAKGDIDRKIPGTTIGFSLFDRLLCLFSYYAKKQPFRVIVSRAPGFEYMQGPENTMDCIPAPDIRVNTVGVLYNLHNDPMNPRALACLKI